MTTTFTTLDGIVEFESDDYFSTLILKPDGDEPIQITIPNHKFKYIVEAFLEAQAATL